MKPTIGNYVACGLLAVIILIFLPVILLPLLLLVIIQALTGRRMVYWSRFRPMGPRPQEPENDPAPGDAAREVRASEAVIDAEVIDLPDEPPAAPPRLEKRGDR
ncbi:hypothetical protein SDC9_106147 [bioreactor metagenome]|uniref:Uncharacterized protein n=1 Tax=bioreactor metagenome TaxID=1076179 RepID=A0A645B1M5_9ZZZZ